MSRFRLWGLMFLLVVAAISDGELNPVEIMAIFNAAKVVRAPPGWFEGHSAALFGKLLKPAWKFAAEELTSALQEESRRARATLRDVAVSRGNDVIPPFVTFTLDCPYPPHLQILMERREMRMVWDGGKQYRVINR